MVQVCLSETQTHTGDEEDGDIGHSPGVVLAARDEFDALALIEDCLYPPWPCLKQRPKYLNFDDDTWHHCEYHREQHDVLIHKQTTSKFELVSKKDASTIITANKPTTSYTFHHPNIGRN